jgi:hypothetical protein
MMKRIVPLIVGVFLLAAVSCQTNDDGGGNTDPAISVDFGNIRGQLYKPSQYNNIYAEAEFPVLADDAQFYRDQELTPKIVRLWLGEHEIYNPGNGRYDYTAYDAYFTKASVMADSICVVLTGDVMTHSTENNGWGYNPNQVKPVIKTIVKHLKEKFPKLEHVEAMNEPNNPTYQPGMSLVTPDTVYDYYKVYYEAINEINSEVSSGNQLKIGSPALFYLDFSWLDPFLDAYRDDPSPGKRLDFINYHAYLGPGDAGFVMYKEDPSAVASQRAQVESALLNRGLSADIPSFITETGMYPGPSGDGTVEEDSLRQAAGMASLHYWYMNDSGNYPFNWIVRHPTNGRKDQLVSERDAGGRGTGGVQKFTPYGNVVKMQSMMKDTRVEAESNSISGGKGVYALAAKDGSSASIMVWNYQSTGTDDFDVDITMNGLGSVFGGSFKIKIYSIDSKTSNWFYDNEKWELQMVKETTVSGSDVSAKGYNTPLHLEANSVHLLVLEAVQ